MVVNQNSINLLRDSLTLQNSLRGSLDQKASFLVGIAAVIFGLSMIRIEASNFLVLAISSFITLVMAITVVFLPFRGKRKERLSFICWWGFSDKGLEEYEDKLKKVFDSDDKMAEEYMREIWTMTNYSIKPKSKILKFASFILVFGLLIGFVLSFV
ncbi:MAG: hypothetical protein PHH01_00010 [Patescibacteria group bacterium]|nr:hypothetical protein [Patescibacteria group bacterium]MDD5566575.1 hypothetical protein [Patescibacteria group bacterium]